MVEARGISVIDFGTKCRICCFSPDKLFAV